MQTLKCLELFQEPPNQHDHYSILSAAPYQDPIPTAPYFINHAYPRLQPNTRLFTY